MLTGFSTNYREILFTTNTQVTLFFRPTAFLRKPELLSVRLKIFTTMNVILLYTIKQITIFK